MRSRVHGGRIAAALLVVVALAFTAPYLFQGKSLTPLDLLPAFPPWSVHAKELGIQGLQAHNPQLDSIQQYYPRRVLFRQELAAGRVPLWNPYVYGGSSFAGSQQGALLYPPAWLLAVLSPELQFGASAAIHLLIGLLGALLFFRRLGLSPVAAAAGAVAWSLNGFLIAWLAYPNVGQWTLMWLPLSLYAAERGHQEGTPRFSIFAGLILGVSLLGGHAQSSLYLLLAWVSWTAPRAMCTPDRWRRLIVEAVAPLALGILIAGGQLLPALDYLPRTDRAGRVPWDTVQQSAMPPLQLLTLVLPRLFGDATLSSAQQFWLPAGGHSALAFAERAAYPGIVVLALSGAGFAAARRGGALRFPLCYGAALSVLALLWALGTPLYWPLWRFAPGFAQFTAVARIVCLMGWGLAVLVGVGLSTLEAGDPALRSAAARISGFAAGALALLALAAHFIYGGAGPAGVNQFLSGSGMPTLDTQASLELGRALSLLLALGAALWGCARGRREGTLAGAVLVTADLFLAGFGYNPRADARLASLRPPELTAIANRAGLERFLSFGPPGQELSVNKRLPSNMGAALGLADLSGSDSFVPRRYREWEHATAAANGGAALARPGNPNFRSAGVGLYLLPPEVPSQGFGSILGPWLRQDTAALPYARWHGWCQALPERTVLENLSQPQRAPAVALLEGEGAPSVEGPPLVEALDARRTGVNRVRIDGTVPARGAVVLCEAFDPGWRARVNGRPAAIFPADHLMSAVAVEAGRQRIEFTYAPASWRAGLFLSLIGLALASAGLAAGGRTGSRNA